MSNYRRVFIPGGVFFFTVVTHERARIFTSEERVEEMRAAFRKIMSVRPFRMDAMVILPDHLHCLWRLPAGDDDYSGRWREIKKAVSRRNDSRINHRKERAVWQRRFWEHAIRDDEDCQSRKKKCETDAGMPCNLLKSQWRMLSVLSFCEVIKIGAITWIISITIRSVMGSWLVPAIGGGPPLPGLYPGGGMRNPGERVNRRPLVV